MVAWTETFFPHALFGSIPAPAFWAHRMPAEKYVTKSTVCSRSLVSVNDDMPTLKVSPWIDGMIFAKSASRYSAGQAERGGDRVHQIDVEADDLAAVDP